MPFNINEFKGTMSKYGGPAKKNLYIFELADGPGRNSGMEVSDLRFFAQTVTIPGLNYQVANYFPNTFGVRQTIPTAVTPDPLNAAFMLDSDHMVLKFLHQWMQKVINYNYSDGAFSAVNGQLPYEIGYKEDYATTATIKHFSTDAKANYYTDSSANYYEYTFYDVFPTQVTGVDVAWSDNDSYATATVNFAYSHMKVSGEQTATPTERFARGTGYLGLLNRYGVPGQFIEQTGLPRTIQDAINLYSNVTNKANQINSGFSQIKSGLKF